MPSPSSEHVSGQKHSSLAFEAFKANVGAHPHQLPLVAAAGVWVAQPPNEILLMLRRTVQMRASAIKLLAVSVATKNVN
jgi:hypothetical protein